MNFHIGQKVKVKEEEIYGIILIISDLTYLTTPFSFFAHIKKLELSSYVKIPPLL